jgi:hypothetical protein
LLNTAAGTPGIPLLTLVLNFWARTRKKTGSINLFCMQHQPFSGLANFDVFRFFHFYKDAVVNEDGVSKNVGVLQCKVSVTEDVWHDTAGNRSKTIPLFKGTKELNARLVIMKKVEMTELLLWYFHYRSSHQP